METTYKDRFGHIWDHIPYDECILCSRFDKARTLNSRRPCEILDPSTNTCYYDEPNGPLPIKAERN